jgi:hypothetical protein
MTSLDQQVLEKSLLILGSENLARTETSVSCYLTQGLQAIETIRFR